MAKLWNTSALKLVAFFVIIICCIAAAARIGHYKWEVKYEYKSPDCYKKLITTINGRSPGPSILAQQNDAVIVDAKNSNLTENLPIHWHGTEQAGAAPSGMFLRLRRIFDSFFSREPITMPCPQQNESLIYQKASVPECFPITNLQDLRSKAYAQSIHYEFIRSSVPLPIIAIDLPNQRRILSCHDMRNGYLDDRFVQGGNNANAYAFWHWEIVDVFVYFSHNLVTVPPVRWINEGHTHGVKVLGTFIMEGNFCGKPTCEELLSSGENARMYAKLLAELAKDIGFDGWLINVEIRFVHLVNNLKIFVSHLTEEMHSLVKGSLVIWYDAVTEQGLRLSQNQLNSLNKCFFDICDGIFTNYGWKKDYLKRSADIADYRRFDVYMGIDVFGRHGTYGGGEWNTNAAVHVVKEANVSAAIFAPGWVYETNQPPDFQTAQNKWWGLVGEAWEIDKLNPKSLYLPLYLDFDKIVSTPNCYKCIRRLDTGVCQ